MPKIFLYYGNHWLLLVDVTYLCNCNSEQCNTPFYNRLCHDGNECIHLDGTRHTIKSDDLICVRYKFKDDAEFITVTVTEQQYLNLREVEIITKCEILGSAQNPISDEEKELFNQKILITCKNNSNFKKYLLH